MAVNDNGLGIFLSARAGGKTARMQREMFNTQEKIAIVSKNGVRYSEWADAEEIK